MIRNRNKSKPKVQTLTFDFDLLKIVTQYTMVASNTSGGGGDGVVRFRYNL